MSREINKGAGWIVEQIWIGGHARLRDFEKSADAVNVGEQP